MLYNLAYKLRTDRQKGAHYSHRVLSILCMWTLTGPLMVPEASRSPGLTLQPLTVWWASCCFMVQYMYLSQRDRNKNKTLVNSRWGQSWYAAAQHAFLLCTLFCVFYAFLLQLPATHCHFQTSASAWTWALLQIRPTLSHLRLWDHPALCGTLSETARNTDSGGRKQKWGWRTIISSCQNNNTNPSIHPHPPH